MSEDSYSTSGILKNVEYNLNENIIICGKIPSLEYMCQSSIVINIWQQVMKYEIENVLSSIQHGGQEGNMLGKKLSDISHKTAVIASRLNVPFNGKMDLELMNEIIESELEHFFRSENIYFIKDNRNALKVFLDNLCWSQVGTINYLKTAKKIIASNDPSMTTEIKYIFACYNCLEDEIRELYELLPVNFLDNLIEYSNVTNFPVYCLMLFWTYFVRGEIENYPFLTNNYILQMAIKNRHYVAVQYIWKNFADNSMRESLVRFAYLFFKNFSTKILLFLCKQMSQTQLDEIGWHLNLEMLKELHNLSKCYNVISVSDYVLELIKKVSVLEASNIVTFKWFVESLNRNQYLIIWRSFACLFKSDIERNFNEIWLDNSNCLIYDKNWIAMNLLLKMCSIQDRKDLVYTDDVEWGCIKLIQSKQLDHFNKLIKQFLDTEEEISKFKRIFFAENYVEIFLNQVPNYSYEFLEKVLNEFCIKDISAFKRKIPYKEEFVNKFWSVNTIILLDEFLKWSFDGNEKKISKFKSVVYNLESNEYYNYCKLNFFLKLKDFITNKQWKELEDNWKWVFYIDESKIQTPIQKYERIKKILYLTSPESCNELLHRFITSCLREKDINEIKEILKESEEMQEIVENLLQHEKYAAIDELLGWCLASKEKIAECKSNVMNKIGLDILLKLIRRKNCITKVKSLFRWFNPFAKSAKLFKQSCVHIQQKTYYKTRTWKKDNKRIETILELLVPYISVKRTLEQEHDSQLDQGSKGKNISVLKNKKIKLNK